MKIKISRRQWEMLRTGQTANVLNGKTKQKAKSFLHRITYEPTRYIYKDDYWQGPRQLFERFEYYNIDYKIVESKYGVSKTRQEMYVNQPEKLINDYKMWSLEIAFINEKGTQTTLYATLTAHGAGAENNPLEKYDLTFAVS